jgi:molybdopterin-guanine dinucleotide biosynthesis protein A
MQFHQEARNYIGRLINLQRHIPKQYKRIDQVTVIKSIDTLETYLAFYPYNTDPKMRTFWRKHRHRIQILLPRKDHSAFAKLLVEFERLDSYAQEDADVAVWDTVTSAI